MADEITTIVKTVTPSKSTNKRHDFVASGTATAFDIQEDGSTTTFGTDLKAYIDEVATTAFTSTTHVVTFTTAPTVGQKVSLRWVATGADDFYDVSYTIEDATLPTPNKKGITVKVTRDELVDFDDVTEVITVSKVEAKRLKAEFLKEVAFLPTKEVVTDPEFIGEVTL